MGTTEQRPVAADEPAKTRRGALSVGAAFTFLQPEAAKAVVTRALAFRAEASVPVRQAFDAAIRKSVKLKGFRDASRANAKQLEASVIDEIDDFNDRIAAATLRTWHESQPELRQLVGEYLRAADVTIDPDPKLERLRIGWTANEWRDLRSGLLTAHEHLDEDDAILMLVLASGTVPNPEDQPLPLESLRFQRWLEELERLPNDAPDWRDAHLFADMVAELAEKKVEELIDGHVSSLAEGIKEVRGKYKEELRYLGVDMDTWFEDAKERLATIPDAEIIVADLKSQLKAYQPIRPQAPLREEEKRRSEAREKCERAVLALVKSWQELMSQPLAVADEHEQYVTEPNAEVESPVASKELDALQERLEKVEGEYDNLKAENARLNGTNTSMQLEKEELGEQIRDLKKALKGSKETEQHWRRAFVNRKRGSGTANVTERVSFASVGDVIAQAEHAFADELLFALNGKSHKHFSFQKPDEVFDALAWLATEYHRLRPDPGPSPDFDRLLKEACPGWSYKPNQTDTTMGMYPEWYKTSVGSKTYDLPHHIGKGNSFDPKNTIRIAFAWDGDRNQVVVGFIGLHQRNRHS